MGVDQHQGHLHPHPATVCPRDDTLTIKLTTVVALLLAPSTEIH